MGDQPIKPARGEPYGLAGQMQQAFEQVGATMISDELAAELLAYCYVIGSEACVLHPGLNAGIQMAQQRANLYGAHIPEMKILALTRMKIDELERIRDANKDKEHELIAIARELPWFRAIHVRYDLSLGETSKSQKKKPKPDDDDNERDT